MNGSSCSSYVLTRRSSRRCTHPLCCRQYWAWMRCALRKPSLSHRRPWGSGCSARRQKSAAPVFRSKSRKSVICRSALEPCLKRSTPPSGSVGTICLALTSVEAIWLSRVLLELMPGEAEVQGLLALMLHCEARRPARRRPDGRYIPLSEQDPKQWSLPLVEEAER